MHEPTPASDATGLRIAVIVSRYHGEITARLASGARDAFVRAGGRREDLLEIEAPGAFELPVIAAAAAARGDLDAVVALGCIVAGETRHDRYLASAVASGLTRVSLDALLPVTFGVLTVPSPEHARQRAGGAHGNKGAEAMASAIQACRSLRRCWARLSPAEAEIDPLEGVGDPAREAR